MFDSHQNGEIDETLGVYRRRELGIGQHRDRNRRNEVKRNKGSKYWERELKSVEENMWYLQVTS